MTRWYRGFILFMAVVLAVGILPSFTALSWQLFSDFPSVSRYLGPINVLKLYAPFALYFLWRERRRLSPQFWRIYLGILAFGSLSSLIAWIPCGFPSTEIRDWGVIVLGTIYSLTFLLLPKRHAHAVIVTWVALIAGTALLQILWPHSIEWLYANIFDPQTPITDYEQTRTQALSGVFSRQSMAKLLTWVPWLALAYSLAPKSKGWVTLAAGSFCIFGTGAVLATTQRGPFLAAVIAWVAFAAHQSLRVRDHATALIGAVSVGISLILMVAIVPNDLIKERFSFISKIGKTDFIDPNLVFRKRVVSLSVEEIKSHPFGNACIPAKRFQEDFLIGPSHSHSLYLQQFLARGWLWGAFHTALWLLALVGAWRLRTAYGSALFAGLVTITLSGLVDHPWFPLNHSMILGIFLVRGLMGLSQKAKGTALNFH